MTAYQGPKGAAFDPVVAVPLPGLDGTANEDDAPMMEDMEKGYTPGEPQSRADGVEAEGSRRGSAQSAESGVAPDRKSRSRKGKEREQGKHGKGLTDGDAGELRTPGQRSARERDD